jgi:hypothetical protein
MVTSSDIQETIVALLAEGVACEPVGPGDERVACMTPLQYPDGDSVTVWVGTTNGSLQVTDYGIGFQYFLTHPPQDFAALRELARDAARAHGVEFGDGRLSAWVADQDAAEAVWRVALASAQIAQSAAVFRPKRRQRVGEFEKAVDATLTERKVKVSRAKEVAGASGHIHHVTFYLPERETVLEPVAGAGHISQISAVYLKFGDISERNGHRLFALVDDREASLQDDLTLMLGQVGDVVSWSQRDRWMEEVM